MRNINPNRGERGFTYIGLLLAVALFGVALAAVGQVWHTTLQREKERELLFIGDEFRRAIAQYYDDTPGKGAKEFPRALEDLLVDRRYPVVRRYLRKIYADPLSGKPEWGLVKGPGDTIMGVYSLSRQAPRKQRNFPEEYVGFEGAKTHSDWRFVHAAPSAPSAPAPVAQGRPAPAAAVLKRGPIQPPSAAR